MTRPTLAIAALLAASISGSAEAQTFTLIEPMAGAYASGVSGLSDDGLIAVGNSTGNVASAFRWTAVGGRYDLMSDPGSPPSYGANGVSGNGNVLVGAGRLASGRIQAYRWTGPGQYQLLGTTGGYQYSRAMDTNHDGSVVVGTLHEQSNFFAEAFRWTACGIEIRSVPLKSQHGCERDA